MIKSSREGDDHNQEQKEGNDNYEQVSNYENIRNGDNNDQKDL